MVDSILNDVQATEYQLFLSGDTNFRDSIFPAYKANRKGKPRPKWLYDCKEYLVTQWDAEVTEGCEADDALGIACTSNPGSIICSIDKDLRQIAGKHFNFVTKVMDEVSESRGIRTFYEQLLTGDPGDNIAGCPGIGKKKAPRILEGCETPDDMFNSVREAYNNDQLMLLNGKLLWIWRKENDIWHDPRLQSDTGTEQDQEVA